MELSLRNLTRSKNVQDLRRITAPPVDREADYYYLIRMIFLTVRIFISDEDGWTDVERYRNAKLDGLRT
jgi:hypothetical protein